MPLFKTLEVGEISAGANKSVEWTPDTDIVIHKVMVVEKNNKPLSAVKAYLKFAGNVMTEDFVPASVFGQDPEYCYKPEYEVGKGTKIYAKFTNEGTEAVTLYLVFEFDRK